MAGEISYQKTADDMVQMYRDLVRANLRRRYKRAISAVMLGSVAMVLIGRVFDSPVEGGGGPFYGAAFGVLLFAPLCWIISYALLPRRVRRIFAQQRTKDPIWTWRWSDQGLASHTDTGDNRYGCSEIHHWIEGKRTLMFFLNDNHVLYIPRRVLTVEQTTDLRTLAEDGGIVRY